MRDDGGRCEGGAEGRGGSGGDARMLEMFPGRWHGRR
jgi:hypothetical protein